DVPIAEVDAKDQPYAAGNELSTRVRPTSCVHQWRREDPDSEHLGGSNWGSHKMFYGPVGHNPRRHQRNGPALNEKLTMAPMPSRRRRIATTSVYDTGK